MGKCIAQSPFLSMTMVGQHVDITRSSRHLAAALATRAARAGAIATVGLAVGAIPQAIAQPVPPAPVPVRQPMTVISDVQEANSIAGIVTARGNVQVDYPSRMLKATAAQAQYFSNERRLVMSGDVFVLQDGNSLRAETVTYYVDEGRSIALPLPNRQVESVYLVLDTTTPTVLPSSSGPAGGQTAAPGTPSLFAPAVP